MARLSYVSVHRRHGDEKEGRKMSDIQEIHGALSGPQDEQSELPRAAAQVKAGVVQTGRWLLDEMRGWHRRRLAVRVLAQHIGRSAR